MFIKAPFAAIYFGVGNIGAVCFSGNDIELNFIKKTFKFRLMVFNDNFSKT